MLQRTITFTDRRTRQPSFVKKYLGILPRVPAHYRGHRGTSYRICRPKSGHNYYEPTPRRHAAGSKMGLPELQLGIIPGFGGTQRLPRLVGLQKAIEMMLTSKQINHEAALKLGLVDAVAPKEQLLAAARAHALDMARGRKPRMMSLTRWVRVCWVGGVGGSGRRALRLQYLMCQGR